MSMNIDTKVYQTNNTYNSLQNTAKADSTTEAKANTKSNADIGVVYEKSAGVSTNKPTYEINKKSETDRSAIVEQLRKETDAQKQSLINMVRNMMGNQAKTQKAANGFDVFGGTVTEEARKKAAEAISEDGYWGVKQTSQRLFDFASALAGDDVEKMKKMQAAMNKGINQAAAKLGGLPSISQQTQDAANNLFSEYYKSKGVEE